nr:hypothetical protein [Tanacetum cinerariifolium]
MAYNLAGDLARDTITWDGLVSSKIIVASSIKEALTTEALQSIREELLHWSLHRGSVVGVPHTRFQGRKISKWH